ncbi:hypothetical protein HK096_006730 [Nowakowskiella sp. JEL0078]|nr:hypothetical protein HK096_006730 [Nowakowskiella sp. JEL0078]
MASGAVARRKESGKQTADNEMAALIPLIQDSAGALLKSVKRSSGLLAPIMLLSGHAAEVFSVKFSPNGQSIASSSFDREIFLWNTYGECQNYLVLKGHAGVVLEIQWSRDGSQVYSASTDKTVGIWDATTGERVKKFKGHTSYVNSLSPSSRGNELIASASDDNTIRIWDLRVKNAVEVLNEKYQATAVCWNNDGSTVFSGGIDNEIKMWDLRKNEIVTTLTGHADTITGLRLSPDGGNLLSNAMDNTVRIWDVKPFASTGTRLLKVFEVNCAPHGMEKNLLRPCWSPDGDFIASGAADRTVVVWNVVKGQIAYKLPGHKGCVNEVDWHPKEPIIASGSSDRTLFVGEINPSEVK